MPHPVQMFDGNLSNRVKSQILVIRSTSVTMSQTGVKSDQWMVSMHIVALLVKDQER